MKRSNYLLKIWFAIAFVVFGFSNSFAQPNSPEPASALMYEISGNGLTKPSYLFGTMHIICPDDMIATKEFDNYINQTERVIMEVDFDDQAGMIKMVTVAYLPKGKTLLDFLTVEEYAKVGVMVRSFLGIPIENVKNMHPVFLAVMITTSPKVLGCSSPASYELLFLQTATAGKKPIEGLETVAIQLDVINSTLMTKHAENLYKMALDPQKSIDEFKKLIAIYKSQDSDKIYEFIQKSLANDPSFEANLLDKRNLEWIPKIEKAVKEKSSFIAVGAAHLGGDSGILSLLRKKNYVIKPIRL